MKIIEEDGILLKIEKNGQAPFIAPLQPFTLAVFPLWGSSKGAGRKGLTHGGKSSNFFDS